MRTKTLLLAAALSAAGLATSMAQTVYSVNAVGYVNLVIPPGFSILANPLDGGGTNNSVAALFPSVPNNFTIYKFTAANGYTPNRYRTTGIVGWTDPTTTLLPGEGAFVSNPTTSAITNTFVGTVMSGSLTNGIATGLQIKSSQVPQAGKLQTDLGLVPAVTGTASLTVYQFDGTIAPSGGYITTQYRFGAWNTEPTIKVAEGFFVNTTVAQNWTRTFSIGN